MAANENAWTACQRKTSAMSMKINDGIEDSFEKFGRLIARWPALFCTILSVILLLFIIMLPVNYEIETNIFDLWTPTDSPVFDEREFVDEYWSDNDYGLMILAAYSKDGMSESIMTEEVIEEWWDLHVDMAKNLPKLNWTYNETQTFTWGYFAEGFGEVQSLDDLSYLADETVPGYASEVIDICRQFATSPLQAQFELPCYMFSVLDCFSEGGVFFPYESYLEKTFLTAIYDTNPYLTKPSFQGMDAVELGNAVKDSCDVFTGTTVPFNYIMGGEDRVNDDDNSTVTEFKSLETVFFVDSPYNLARKLKIATQQCTYTSTYAIACDNPTDAEKEEAAEFLDEWLLGYIDYIAGKVSEFENDDTKHLKLVYWTPRTASDLLKEASEADFGLLAIAYITMIVFASGTAFRPRNLFLSRTEASCTGVLIVLVTVMATMGLGACFWKFSPNVLQVLPFIALGFGVDDMFVLLFAFHFDEKKTEEQMIGEATRLAGSSIALTSSANFFAFLIASFMVLPDVSRFAKFGMLMVLLNFFAILIGFGVVLTMVAKRMKKGYIDCGWCLCYSSPTKAKQITNEKPPEDDASIFDPCFDFLARTEVRLIALVLFFGLFGVGVYGCGLAKLGLPLAHIVPEGSYAQQLLAVRQEFYSTYLLGIYTDADGADLKPIDWPNKFDLFVENAKNIYDMSDLVYHDASTHSFWGLDLAEYFAEKREIYYAYDGYVPEMMQLSTAEGKSRECEADRLSFCPSWSSNYTYGSDLFMCLYFNYDELSDNGCQAWLDEVAPSNGTVTIAKQVNIFSTMDDDVSGVYLAPSDDETNVFTRADGAILFQRYDLTWLILDSTYNLLYTGLSTEENSIPSQYGWIDDAGEMAYLTLVYFDQDIYDEDVYRGDGFIYEDVAERTTFVYDYSFVANEDSDASCYEWEVNQKMMSNINSFSSISLTSTEGSVSFECDSTLEASSLCVAFYNNLPVEPTFCVGSTNSNWWAGDCGDGHYTVVASDNTASISNDTEGCYCHDPTVGTPANGEFTFMSVCGGGEWGGANINPANGDTCNAVSQEMIITCEKLTECTTMDACYEDVGLLDDAACTDSAISQYKNSANYDNMATCLLPNYALVSTCCQEALYTEILSVEDCSWVNTQSDSNTDVCAVAENCAADCSEFCFGDYQSDCYDLIEAYCPTEWAAGVSSDLSTCINTNIAAAAIDGVIGDCCVSSWAADKVSYDGCLFPRSSYYNTSEGSYDYSECAYSDVVQLGCQNITDSDLELECMLDSDYQSVLSDSCCLDALEMIEPQYIFTRDCQVDVEDHCTTTTNAADITENCVAALSSAKTTGTLSPNCDLTLSSCGTDGDWPVTAIGSTAVIDCADGYDGTRTRYCGTLSTLSLVANWDNATEDACTVQYCQNVTENGQFWREVPLGNVRSYISNDVVFAIRRDCYDYGYLERYCGLGGDGNPQWSNATFRCKPVYGEWGGSKTDDAVCDPETESLVGYLDVSDYDDEDLLIEDCQSYCLVKYPLCQFFLYDTQSLFCYFYDYCEVANATVMDRYELYMAPCHLAEFVSGFCAAQHKSVTAVTAWSEEGVPHPICWNASLWNYFVDPTGGVLYQDKLIFNDRGLLYETVEGMSKLEFVTSACSVTITGMDDDEVAVELIKDIRSHLGTYWNDRGIYVIPGGLILDLFTQYLGVEKYLVMNLLYVCIAVVITGIIFLLNPIAVLVVLACNAAMITEVYGFVDWAGLRVNGVLALNIIIAVGLTMEFTAHMGRAFVLQSAAPNEKLGMTRAGEGQVRMKKAYREMFTPVTLGAITTFLGVVPISAAKFPYFRQYYFILYMLIVIFGWLNGVIFQPVILSFLNPATFHHDDNLESIASGNFGAEIESGGASAGGAATNEVQPAQHQTAVAVDSQSGPPTTTDVELQAKTSTEVVFSDTTAP